jgi:hypothetical protein
MKTKLTLMSLLFCAGAQAQISGQLFYSIQATVQTGYVTGVRESSTHEGRSCSQGVSNGAIHKKVIDFIENDKDVLQFTAFEIVDGVLTKWWPCPKKGQL